MYIVYFFLCPQKICLGKGNYYRNTVLKIGLRARCTQEMEIKRIPVQGQLRQKKKKKEKLARPPS
jgi:hypothetical protein